ncbi:hypothetical protein LTR72_011109 [Exophiala xenobiotica]|nr:hypothetical protein LTR72_011109 [Exophiala xenobiotica]KAK5284978.1 hypothetical protein LTR14_011345 [Exophiala xenobiotica]KAK5471434.1 hypothetical protein LTR55_010852 [Exophiala xenobiotica]
MALPKTFPMQVENGKTVDVPVVGFGTWAAGANGWCKKSTLAALKAGYRHLDCAWIYGVDQEVGEAIRESGIPRSEIFVTSKFWMNFAAPENVELCLDKILRNMGLDYIDLFLSHFPVAFKPTSAQGLAKTVSGSTATTEQLAILEDPDTHSPAIDWEHCSSPIARKSGQTGSFVPTWKAVQRLVPTGKVRAVGVSNFSVDDLQDLAPHATDIPISCNQIEVHPWLPNNEVVDYARQHKILVTAYSPFAGQKEDGQTLIKDETVQRIAVKKGMDVGQTLQSWAVQRGTVPLGKSQTEGRIRSNLNVRKLPDEDFEALNALAMPHAEGRTINFSSDWKLQLF